MLSVAKHLRSFAYVIGWEGTAEILRCAPDRPVQGSAQDDCCSFFHVSLTQEEPFRFQKMSERTENVIENKGTV
jgi:hypothetical protein